MKKGTSVVAKGVKPPPEAPELPVRGLAQVLAAQLPSQIPAFIKQQIAKILATRMGDPDGVPGFGQGY